MSENKNISQDVVAHMAQLSRLAVSDEEKALFARQFGDILAYMDVLAQVDTAAAPWGILSLLLIFFVGGGLYFFVLPRYLNGKK